MTKNQRRIARAEKNRESVLLGVLARVDAGVQGSTRHAHVMWPCRNMAPKSGFKRRVGGSGSPSFLSGRAHS